MSKVCKKSYITPKGDSKTVSPDATALRFTFADGTVKTVSLTDFPANILDAAKWHGLSQKLGDAYASAITTKEAVVNFDDTLEQLLAGDWNTRQGGGKLAALAEAVARVQGKDVSAVMETLATLTEEKLDGVRKNPDVQAALAAITAENKAAKAKAKAGDGPSLDDLLTA